MITQKNLLFTLLCMSFTIPLLGCTSPCALTQVGSSIPTGSGQAPFPTNLSYSTDGATLGVTNYYSNTITLYPVSASDCSILDTTIAQNVTTGNGPIASAFSPNGIFLAISNYIDGTITVYNRSTNQQVPGSPFSTGGIALNTATIAYSPDGAYLAAGNILDGTLYLFAVQADGSLLLSQIVSTGSGSFVSSIAFTHSTSSNSYLAVANRGVISASNIGNVSVYQLTSGTLTLINSYAAGDNPYAVAFSPDDAFLAAANYTSQDVTTYSLDATTGTLTVIGSYPTNAQAQTAISFSFDGSCLAVNSQPTNEAIVFSVDAGGALILPGTSYNTGINSYTLQYSPTNACLAVGTLTNLLVFPGNVTNCDLGAPVQYTVGGGSGSQPVDVAFSPNNSFLAIANSSDDTIAIFQVNSSGNVTQITGSPYALAAGSIPFTLQYSPNGTLLAVANSGNNTVSIFTVATNGTLTEVSGSPFATGTNPQEVTFSPNGQFLAVSNLLDNTVSIFSIAATGIITPITGSPFVTGANPQGLTYSPNGQYLAVVNNGDNTVSIFEVAFDGSIVVLGTYPTGTVPTFAAFSPNGSCLAVSNSTPRPGTISLFTVATDGALTETTQSPYALDADPISRGPNILAYSPNGLCLAVANTGSGFASGSVAVMANNGCVLSPTTGSPYFPGFGPNAVAYSPNGRFLAVVNNPAGTVTLYRTGSSGTISALAQAIIDKYC